MWQVSLWRNVLISAACLCFVLSSVHPNHAAASPNAPLIIAVKDGQSPYINNAYYAWYGADQPLKRLTKHGFNDDAPILSPDNRYIAYMLLPELLRRAYSEEDFSVAGVLPADIALIDLTSGELTLIAGQPNLHSADECMWGCWMRSSPSWSPDSKMIAWTEVPYNDPEATAVMVYDLANQTTQQIATKLNILDMYVGDVSWGAAGIVVWEYAEQDNLKVLDAAGKQVFTMTLTGGSLQWVQDGDQEFLYFSDPCCSPDSPKTPLLIDVVSGEQRSVGTLSLELYSLNAPDGASVLKTQTAKGYNAWQFQMQGQELPRMNWADDGHNVAISPDGRQVAYSDHQKIVIYSEGQTMEVPLEDKGEIFGIAWGAMGWRVANITR